MMELTQSFHFDAAHTLKREVEAEGSRRVHGHTYHAEVTVRGEPDPANGMVLDLGVLKAEIAGVREQLDHHMLNEVPGMGIPTLENLCRFIGERLRGRLPGLASVTVARHASGDRCTLRF